MFEDLFFLLLVFLGYHFQRMMNNQCPININYIKLVSMCSLAYACANRSFMFIQWGYS